LRFFFFFLFFFFCPFFAGGRVKIYSFSSRFFFFWSREKIGRKKIGRNLLLFFIKVVF